MTGAVDMIALSGNTRGANGVAEAGNQGLMPIAAQSTRDSTTASTRAGLLDQLRLTLAEAAAQPILAGEDIATTQAAADSGKSATQRQLNGLQRQLLSAQAEQRVRYAAAGITLDDGTPAQVEAAMGREAGFRAQDIQAEGDLRQRALSGQVRSKRIQADLRQRSLLAQARGIGAQSATTQRNADTANLFALSGGGGGGR